MNAEVLNFQRDAPKTTEEFIKLILQKWNAGISDDVSFDEEFEIKEIEYVEAPYFAKRFTTALFGDSGAAKSMMTTAKACQWSREGKKVIYINTEDDAATMFNQRLKANKANLDNLKRINKAVAYDNPNLLKLIVEYKPDVIVFDMIKDMTPTMDIVMNSRDIRKVLSYLNAIAEITGCCCIVLHHSNKAGGNKSSQRIQGTMDWFGKSRCVLEVSYDEKNKTHNVFHSKANYTKKVKGFAFSIDAHETGEPVVCWKSEMTMDESDLQLAGNKEDDEKTKIKQAEELLYNFLDERSSGGEHEVPSQILQNFIDEEVKPSGISQKTFRRGRDNLKKDKIIKYVKIGNVPCWKFLNE